MTIDVTAVINGHREGLLAVATLRSVAAAVRCAEEGGLHVEILSILDRPDTLTREVFDRLQRDLPQSRILAVDHGDLGRSRNSAVAAAKGRRIAFIDADDLWGENWLLAAVAAAEADPRSVVWHPETNLMFGARPHVFDHMDMDDAGFQLDVLALRNPWTALAMADRTLLSEVHYPSTDLTRQIGYEDWGWNIRTIENGAVHKIVPDTMHAIRTKTVSLVSRSTADRCRPAPTNLFRSWIERHHPSRLDLASQVYSPKGSTGSDHPRDER